MKYVVKKHSSITIYTARNSKRYRTGFFFALPFLTGMCVFLILPFFLLGCRSFFPDGGILEGLENYRNVYASEAFQKAVFHTVILLTMSLCLALSVGVALALFYQALGEKAGILMAAGLLPFLVPAMGAVMTVRIICPDSLFSLSLIHILKYGGFYGLLFVTGIYKIPLSYYEAAKVEGAGYWQQVRLVTIPALKEMLKFVVILGIVHTFFGYREALFMGGTHPPGKLYLMQHYLNNNFEQMNETHLSVASVTVVAGIFLLDRLVRLCSRGKSLCRKKKNMYV
ncbi:MAG: sugar ABC transporter permease [Bacillota bacterium]|nr:sugar ABC transporter permease [Bacillota bacterium]